MLDSQQFFGMTSPFSSNTLLINEMLDLQQFFWIKFKSMPNFLQLSQYSFSCSSSVEGKLSLLEATATSSLASNASGSAQAGSHVRELNHERFVIPENEGVVLILIL